MERDDTQRVEGAKQEHERVDAMGTADAVAQARSAEDSVAVNRHL